MSAATSSAAPASGPGTVLFGTRGACGIITLNRPRAINALDLDMVEAIRPQLAQWARDDRIGAVVLRGAGQRGLCSGGDVRRQRELALGTPEQRERALRFWEQEYLLDGEIAAFPKPFVSFMEGITMGGGIGLAGHSRTRIVTPASQVAMPEMTIGFFPDVGATHLLAAAPGETGVHLALTGAVLSGPEAIYAGLADACIDPEASPGALEALVDRLAGGDTGWTADPVSAGVGTGSGSTALARSREWIDACYQGTDPVAIVARLRGYGDPDASAAADAIESRSPLSVHITLRAMRQAAALPSLTAVLERDNALARYFTDEPDFHEGVRAQLVDKDRMPRWRHAGLAQVTPAEVDAAFRGCPGRA